MTKQNVIVPDAKSGMKLISMAAMAAISNSSLFHANLLKPCSGRYVLVSGPKKLESNTDTNSTNTNSNTKTNPNWVDSMRASSPPKSSPSSVSSDSWMASHPSALEMFDKIIKAAKGKQIVMFLDYDGTLSPIVQDPDRAFMSNEMRAAVKAAAKYFPTAIVTGRCKAKKNNNMNVYDFVKLEELYYAGSHGMDIEGPANRKDNKSIVFQPASEFLVMIDKVTKDLAEKIKAIPGARVENNKFCVSVHFRCVDEKKWGELAELVKEVLDNYQKLKMTHGRKVLEIKPFIEWNKGKALEFLLDALDEDAFKVLQKRKQGFGILVSKFPKETSAAYTLQEPSEVMCFLQRLVEWKQMSQRGYSRP
ncbi:hypothetical protein Cgig2_025840 [Carnegiea gigantea]|uniref:Trehalose 6-phosphate phosphatase n=1 Tax=Carnegiea gigantea TaxID=171969 RepID=A0A9Q1JSZ6_9CARY|nr:hypothetical protein Cgig2_025840 [Carnegiea gigantea]